MWDPSTYLDYSDERGRPFGELLARVRATAPRHVVDLGCGPGTLTLGLARRWPGARVEGVDSSPEMIARASGPGVEFRLGDLAGWSPGPETDVVVSNAALHWVPEHPALLTRWARSLPGGAWLAVQVPGNSGAPSHRAVRALSPVALPAGPVLDGAGYASLLLRAGCAVDAWETTYVHVLPVRGNAHPVLEWLTGTTLRPVRAALGEAEWGAFTAELEGALREAYPVGAAGVLFPFRRVFVVAQTGRG